MLEAWAWAMAWTTLPSLMLKSAIDVATRATSTATALLSFELDSWACATASWTRSSISPMGASLAHLPVLLGLRHDAQVRTRRPPAARELLLRLLVADRGHDD